MNSQAIQNKLNEYYNSATPEQVVKEFEDMDVEFVSILTYKDLRRIVKLYTCLLKDADMLHISKSDLKRMAKTFVELELKYQ